MIYSPKCQQEIRTVTASHHTGYDCVPEQKEVSKLWMTPEMGTLEPPSARRPLPLTFPVSSLRGAQHCSDPVYLAPAQQCQDAFPFSK